MGKITKSGFLKLKHIIGDPKSNPPIPPLIPVGRTTWYNGVKSGRFPKPIPRMIVLNQKINIWREEDILEFIKKINQQLTTENINGNNDLL